MTKTKTIIVSLSAALVFLLIFSFIMQERDNSKYTLVPVFKSNMLQNTILNSNNFSYISVKTSSLESNNINSYIDTKDNTKLVTTRDVYEGEIATINNISKNVEELDFDYEYITIPVSTDSNVICKGLKFGDRISIYFTGKLKDVKNLTENKKRIFSSNSEEALITCALFEDIQVISRFDTSGMEEGGVISHIEVRLSREDAMLVSNLKNLGILDVVKYGA